MPQPFPRPRPRNWLSLGIASAVVASALPMATLPAKPPRPEGLPRFTTVFNGDTTLGPIYYPAHATEDDPERKAAVALAHYLEAASGNKWEVLPEPGSLPREGIFIGRTRRAFVDGLWRAPKPDAEPTLPTDAIRTRVRGKTIAIVGENPTATLSAVYRFLQERTGARWYAPGPHGEEIPQQSFLKLPQKDSHTQPSFRDRQFHLRSFAPEYRTWLEQNGGSHHFSFNHNLYRIFTPELYKEHPEYWAQVFGKRAQPQAHRSARSTQLDYTHPDVARLTAEYIDDYFATHPDRLTFSLGINDNIDFGTDAATLAANAPQRYWRGHPVHSDLVMGFNNTVAQEVAKKYPGRYLTTLAYMWAEALPTFPLLPNLFPYLCIDRAQWYDPQRRQSDSELTHAWANSGAGQLGAWEYYMGGGYFIPRIFNQITAESLKELHEAGYRSLFFENGTNTGFDAPKMWLAAQLAWDIDADAQALLSDFYHGYYGAAAKPMRDFFEYCEQVWMNQKGHSFWLKYFLDPAQAELYPPDKIAHLESLLEAAHTSLDAAEAPERFYHRLTDTEEAFAYFKAAASYYHFYRELMTMPLATAADLNTFAERFADFEAATKALEQAPQQKVTKYWDLRRQLLLLHPQARLGAAFWGRSAGTTPAAPAGETALISPQQHAATLLERVNFSQPILEGDEAGFGPRPPAPQQQLNGWNTRWTHHEGASMTRSPLPGDSGDYELTLTNQEFFSLFRWVAIPAGATHVGIRIRVKGEVSQGTVVQANISYLSGEHKPVGQTIYNQLPPRLYPQWHDFAVTAAVPEGALWVYMGIRVQYQAPQKPLHFSDWEVFTW